jgi:hypothetical protein
MLEGSVEMGRGSGVLMLEVGKRHCRAYAFHRWQQNH